MSVNLVKQWFPQILTALDRAPMAGLLCAVAILFGVTLAWTRSTAAPGGIKPVFEAGASSRDYGALGQSTDKDKTDRLREGGEIINQAGYFRTIGDRVAFVSADNKHRFIALENRGLEQVAETMANDHTQSEWIVSGTISEYRGANFLLLSRAELKSPSYSPNTAQ